MWWLWNVGMTSGPSSSRRGGEGGKEPTHSNLRLSQSSQPPNQHTWNLLPFCHLCRDQSCGSDIWAVYRVCLVATGVGRLWIWLPGFGQGRPLTAPSQRYVRISSPKIGMPMSFSSLACISSKISGTAVKLGCCLHGSDCEMPTLC